MNLAYDGLDDDAMRQLWKRVRGLDVGSQITDHCSNERAL